MTEEMKKKDKLRFIVMRDSNNEIVARDIEAEAVAQKEAERLAGEAHDEEFIVYQRLGSAKVEPKVVWKATR